MALPAHLPAFKLALLFAAGILVNELVSPPFILVLAAMGVSLPVILVAAVPSRWRVGVLPVMIATVMMAVGLGAAKHAVDAGRTAVLPDSLMNTPVVLSGVVISDPTVRDRAQRFLLRSDAIVTPEGILRWTENVMVTFVSARGDSGSRSIAYGMTVGLKGRIERPPAQRNPGDFDARKYYEANGVSFLLRSKGHESMVVFDTAGGSWYMRTIVMPARRYILAWIDATTEGEERELLKGIMLGEKSGIGPSVRSAFTNSGTAHVLAVSGSNVAVVAAFVFFILELLRLRRSARIILTLLCVMLYMLLTGSQPPVVRATIMAGVLLLSQLFQERSRPLNSMGVAALIILAVDARQLFDIGYQLSFAAVLSIILLYPRCSALINRIPGRHVAVGAGRWLLKAAALSLVASLGTVPFTAVSFGKVSVIGIAANAAVVPATGASVVLGLISTCAGLISSRAGEVYAALNSVVLFLTIRAAEFSGGLSIAYIDTFQFRWIHAIPFYIGIGLLFTWTSGRARRIFLPAFLLSLNLLLFLPSGSHATAGYGTLRISFIDVGQGDAVLIQLPDGRVMLVDGGPWSPHFDTGERLVVPFLKRLGITTVDLLVVSHAHADHIGGLGAVFDHLEVLKVVDSGQPQGSSLYRYYREKAVSEGSAYHSVVPGTVVHASGGVRLYALAPMPVYLTMDSIGQHRNLNNTSVVFKLCYGNMSFLLTGDAEEEVEKDLVRVYGDFLHATVLKAGHHGSSTSTSGTFLGHVRPAVTVISVGRNNRFNHPSPLVIERLRDSGSEIYRTDEEGAVILETDGYALRRVDWQ